MKELSVLNELQREALMDDLHVAIRTALEKTSDAGQCSFCSPDEGVGRG